MHSQNKWLTVTYFALISKIHRPKEHTAMKLSDRILPASVDALAAALSLLSMILLAFAVIAVPFTAYYCH